MEITVKIEREDMGKKEVRKALIDIELIPGIKMISGMISDKYSISTYNIDVSKET